MNFYRVTLPLIHLRLLSTVSATEVKTPVSLEAYGATFVFNRRVLACGLYEGHQETLHYADDPEEDHKVKYVGLLIKLFHILVLLEF